MIYQAGNTRRAFVVAAAALPPVGVAQLLPEQGWTWLVSCLAAVAAMGMGGVFEVLRECVRLDGDRLETVHLFRRRRYCRTDFDRVVLEEGRVALRRLDGRWVTLPEVGGSPQALRTAVDSWMRSHR
jgi:hypothetical protein